MLEKILDLFRDVDVWIVGRSLGEIFLIYMVVYIVLRIMQGPRGTTVLRGLAFIIVMISVIILFFVRKLQLLTIDWLVSEFVPVFIIPIIILFQPEFRRALLRLGQNPVFNIFLKPEYHVIDEIVKAVENLSGSKVGAIIAIEREVGLDNFVETGTKIDGTVSSELLCTIFWSGTPLHDGAVIIQGQKLSAAGCLLPLTESTEISKRLGTRHRAGVGLTEETDAVAIVVSEETGTISTGIKGVLTQGIDAKELKRILNELYREGPIAARSKQA
ncbi:MAG: diadenylate cyclase CdaA [Planctomycetota bacterium]